MTRPMRVLSLVKGLGPGGAERLLVSIASVTDPAHVRFDAAYVLPAKNHLVPALEGNGVAVHLLAGPRGLADPRWPVRLLRLARRERYDVVHLHSPAVAAVARVALRLAGRRRPAVVTTEHNVWSSFNRITRAANAITLPLDDVVVTVSEQVRASMSPRWHSRAQVVLHGVPLAELEHAAAARDRTRAALGFADDDVVVVTVANLREDKDYPTLFAAAHAALARDPRLRFVAVGQGQLEHALREQLATLSMGDRFTMLGYRDDVAAVLAAADVFTLTSRNEGLPIALLEALACGLPAVVTDVGGNPSVITDGVHGALVPPGRPDRLADEYVRLAADPARRTQLGGHARARAADFDIARTASILADLYATAVRLRFKA
jgi:glycosyltransferase involved in cell wall biosynthesis